MARPRLALGVQRQAVGEVHGDAAAVDIDAPHAAGGHGVAVEIRVDVFLQCAFDAGAFDATHSHSPD
jgi:hypothetical protein